MSRLAAALQTQNRALRANILREFETLDALRARLPKFTHSSELFQQSLLAHRIVATVRYCERVREILLHLCGTAVPDGPRGHADTPFPAPMPPPHPSYFSGGIASRPKSKADFVIILEDFQRKPSGN